MRLTVIIDQCFHIPHYLSKSIMAAFRHICKIPIAFILRSSWLRMENEGYSKQALANYQH